MNVEINKKYMIDVEKKYMETINDCFVITPAIDDNYWISRVHLYKDQYVVLFPKFFTYGIGFAIEDNEWNVNLPYKHSAEEICNHIWDNHKYDEITKEQVIEAIKLLQNTCEKILKNSRI